LKTAGDFAFGLILDFLGSTAKKNTDMDASFFIAIVIKPMVSGKGEELMCCQQ
jgi:hypothetical protein